MTSLHTQRIRSCFILVCPSFVQRVQGRAMLRTLILQITHEQDFSAKTGWSDYEGYPLLYIDKEQVFLKDQRKNKNKLSTSKHIFVMRVWILALTEPMDNRRYHHLSCRKKHCWGASLQGASCRQWWPRHLLRAANSTVSKKAFACPCSPHHLHQTRWGQHSSEGKLRPSNPTSGPVAVYRHSASLGPDLQMKE